MISVMPITSKELGKLIQDLRKKQGYTQATFAQKLGVSESTVAGYEVGKNNFTVATLKTIAKALNAELEINIKTQ
ncbi:helix-turn-helix domain-containing protein [Larkinella soli]|uniref:helix-turn-helix domain-containing protein n=1 Tax=Larkinella soli TaxID=1770527 RepID=UPI000FFC1FDC|nr:helix-turn-helix transcriptional regulator [Larkinella soli]